MSSPAIAVASAVMQRPPYSVVLGGGRGQFCVDVVVGHGIIGDDEDGNNDGDDATSTATTTVVGDVSMGSPPFNNNANQIN